MELKCSCAACCKMVCVLIMCLQMHGLSLTLAGTFFCAFQCCVCIMIVILLLWIVQASGWPDLPVIQIHQVLYQKVSSYLTKQISTIKIREQDSNSFPRYVQMWQSWSSSWVCIEVFCAKWKAKICYRCKWSEWKMLTQTFHGTH